MKKRHGKTPEESNDLWRRRPLVIAGSVAFVAVAIISIALRPGDDDRRLLARGNEAFEAARYREAAGIYEEEGEDHDFLARQYNAGVSHLNAGDLEAAITRFETVSTRDDDELQGKAFYNLGNCHYRKATAIYREAFDMDAGAETPPPNATTSEEQEDPLERRKRRFLDSVESFRTSIDFYHRVEPPDETTDHNIQVAKTALRQALDEIARIEAEQRRREEDEALKDPAKLLVRLLATEKTHRTGARQIAERGGRERRVGSRSLHKAQARQRVLTERLANLLRRQAKEAKDAAKNAGAAQPGTVQPGTGQADADADAPDPKIQRLEAAIPVLDEAVEAQKACEIAYQKIDPKTAVPEHSKAVAALRRARLHFPLDIAQVVGVALETQRALLAATEQLDEAASGGLKGEIAGSGIGKTVLQTLKDKVLQPLARLMTPSQKAELTIVSEEEDEVIWSAEILSQVEIPASPPAPEGQAPPGLPGLPGGQPAPGGRPQLSEEEAKELSEKVRQQGAIALEESKKAKSLLESAQLVDAIAAETLVVEALEKIAELLPKPEKTVEQRLQELIARQQSARAQTTGLEDLEVSPRAIAANALAASQTEDSEEATKISEKLTERAQQDPKSAEASAKVVEGRDHVLASAVSLEKNVPATAGESIDEAVRLFEEALELLRNDGDDQSQDQQDQDQDQDQDQKQQNQSQQHQGGYQLNPRQARMLKEEMERKREKEEEGLYVAPRSFTVEKDW